MPSRASLLHAFDRMETERIALIAQLDRVPEKRLTAAPKAGAWTVAQVITHIAIAEEGSLAYFTKKHSGGRHKPVGTSAPFRLAILNLAISLPLKYKAPAVVADVPATSYGEAKARWAVVREKLRQVYETLPEAHIGHDLFKHPSLGRFTVLQGVRFTRRHVLRHRGQILRTLRTLG